MKCDRRWWNDGRMRREQLAWSVPPTYEHAPVYMRHPSYLMRISLPKPIDSVPLDYCCCRHIRSPHTGLCPRCRQATE